MEIITKHRVKMVGLFIAGLALTFLIWALVGCGGCAMLEQAGADPNGFVLIDPNQLEAIMNAGKAVTATGVAIGRPELIGLGVLITGIAAAFLSKKK